MRAGIPNNTFRVCSGGGPRYPSTIRSSGITDSRLRLYPDDFLRIPLLRPPYADQEAIVAFIRHADRSLRRYIVAKQRMIALLAELREAVTQDAVLAAGTRSLRLGAVADKIVRPVRRRGDEVYTPVGMYNRGRGIFHKAPTIGSELGDSTFFWIAEGDLVLSGQFAWEGAIALAGQEDQNCIASHRYPLLRGKPEDVDSAYLLAFLRSPRGQVLLDHHSRGAAGRNRPLNIHSLMKETIPIPPLPAQRDIVALIHGQSRLRRTVSALETLLREYRTRLIADVVTGKFDMREVASSLLPSSEERSFDDTEPLFEDDLEDSDSDLDPALEEVEA